MIWWYGLSEKAALAHGALDAGTVRYRMVPIYAYTENVCTAFGEPEIVGSNLFVYSMPFIRYRTEDLGQIDASGYVSSLDGRAQEVLVTQLGTRVPGTTVTIDPFLWDYVQSYQFVQNEPGKLELHIVPRDNYSSDIEKALIANQTKRMAGLFDLSVVYLDHIERTRAGKRRLVASSVSERRALE